ncbi:WD40 repeat domain-containing protein [Streptomyces sp. NPDC055287]
MIGHNDGVLAVTASRDGRVLATAGDNQTIGLWDVSSLTHPKPLGQPLTGHARAVVALAFDSAANTLYSAGADGGTRLWNLQPQHAVQDLCQAMGKTLTRNEWKRRIPQIPYRPTCP